MSVFVNLSLTLVFFFQGCKKMSFDQDCHSPKLNSLQAREPKAIMKIITLNAAFQPTKIGTANGLQITYLKDNSTRNIFVYHEDGKVRAGGRAEKGSFTVYLIFFFLVTLPQKRPRKPCVLISDAGDGGLVQCHQSSEV